MSRPSTSGFSFSAAAGSAPFHPMSDLPALERTIDEIAANAAASSDEDIRPVTAIDADKVWENYNQRRGTPLSAHRRS